MGSEEKVSEKSLALAMKAATRAVELTERRNGRLLDTLARVYFRGGDVSQAIALQKTAVERVSEDLSLNPGKFERKLEEYEKTRGEER